LKTVAQERSKKPLRRREKRVGSGRRKPCPYCKDKVEHVDWRDVATLRRFVSDRGKLRGRRITGACRRHQSQIATAVKRARELALLPYVGEHTDVEGRGMRPDRDEERGGRDDRGRDDRRGR
jgi:small subunit ribosomal protein S18